MYDMICLAMYGDEMYYSDDTQDMIGSQQTVYGLYTNCIQPSIFSAIDSIYPLLAVCLLSSFISRCSNANIVHLTVSSLGIYITQRFFGINAFILGMYLLMYGSELLCRSGLRGGGLAGCG